MSKSYAEKRDRAEQSFLDRLADQEEYESTHKMSLPKGVNYSQSEVYIIPKKGRERKKQALRLPFTREVGYDDVRAVAEFLAYFLSERTGDNYKAEDSSRIDWSLFNVSVNSYVFDDNYPSYEVRSSLNSEVQVIPLTFYKGVRKIELLKDFHNFVRSSN